MNNDEIKAQNQARFGQYAAGYVSSQTHAKGADLARLVELAQPQPDWRILDIATGGGHTALTFATHSQHIIATDLTPKMLVAARDHSQQQGQTHIVYSAADAERLPFADAAFHLVTCRIAPHHFPNIFDFIRESARVLKADGVLLIQDHVLPDDESAAQYVDAFEKLRDPSHVRAYAEYEWRGLFADAGLTVEHAEWITKRHDLISWAERQGCPPDVITRLQVMLVQAPSAVATHMLPEYPGTQYATFCNRHLIILGRKS